MYIAFYRGPGNWITAAIRRVTRGPYSHCELVFSDGTRAGASGRKMPNQATGVRWTPANFEAGWDLISIPVSHAEELAFMRYVLRHAGRRFDWSGVCSFLFPLLRPHPGRRYCTEFVVCALQECIGCLNDAPRKLSPSDLYQLCRQL